MSMSYPNKGVKGGGVIFALLVVAVMGGCGGPEVVGPPTSNYLRWGDKDAETAPTLIEPDHDEDGVLNTVDRCPDLPEDIDGVRDGDGCPDPDDK